MRETVYHIGRNKNSNEIYIFNETVSSSHAQVIIDENGDLIIIDLSSQHGTIVNNNKILSPVKLVKGDVITIGDFNCTQTDLLNAIKAFDFNNKQPSSEGSVPLRSSLEKNIKQKSKKKITKKLVFITLLTIGAIMVILGAIVLYDQLDLKKKFEQRTSVTQKDKDTANSENNANSDKETVTPIVEIKKQRTDITYNFSCLATSGDGGSNKTIFEFGELTRNTQNTVLSDVEITLAEEKEAGNDLVTYYKEKGYIFKKGREYQKVNRIMKNLVKRLANPRGVEYKIHFIEDTTMNIITLGGHILVFKGMYDFCQTDSEIAAIIAHEISHNELGHSVLDLKKRKAAGEWGLLGQIALTMESIVTTSFNQKQETEADLFGMDILYPTSYKNCDAINLWKRMSDSENDFDVAENFFRSHPYSKNRANCVEHHLESNYNQKCNH